jgi:predicted nucleic acid-binding protein
MRQILIDSGILLSYYQQQEPLHEAVVAFFDQNAAQLITSPICIAEVLWLLGEPSDRRVLAAQNHLLGAVSRGGIYAINLVPEDYARIPHCQESCPLGLTRPPGGPTNDHATAL